MTVRLYVVNTLRTVSLFLILLAVAFFTVKWSTIAYLAGAEVKVKPFVIEINAIEYHPDGSVTPSDHAVTARRSNGVIAWTHMAGPVKWGQVARSLRWPDGAHVDFMDSIRAKTTWRPSTDPRMVAARKRTLREKRDCSAGEKVVLGHEQVLGFSTVVVQHSPGPFRITTWLAEDLACQAVQYRAEIKEGESYRLKVMATPVSIREAEPDPRLFDLGSGYEELPPSQVEARLASKAGVSMGGHHLAEMDRQYLKQR